MQELSLLLQKEILNLNRKQTRQIIGFITGRFNPHKTGIFNDEPICQLCLEEEEGASCLIFDSEALRCWRQDLVWQINSEGTTIADKYNRALYQYKHESINMLFEFIFMSF